MLLPDTNDRTILLSRLSKVEQKEAQYPESPYFIGREYRELAISALSICDAAEAVKSSLSAISNAAFRVRFY